MNEAIVIALITALVPSLVTTFATAWQNRQSKRLAAKQSILQMCMEDQFGWETFGRFPTNYGDIQDEYKVYAKNGGNGEVAKKVKEYDHWYEEIEASCKKKKGAKHEIATNRVRGN